MKTFLLIISLFLFMVLTVSGQTVTTIVEVQDTTGTGGSGSKYVDSTVTVYGTISGESWAFSSVYYIQDGTGPWNGILVYDPSRDNAYGDSVMITGDVSEYNGMTQFSNITNYVLIDTDKTVEPALVTSGEIGTGGANAEAYEGCLVKVEMAEITDPSLGYGEWEIDDGSGACVVDNVSDYYLDPSDHDSLKYVIGPIHYDYGNFKIRPRLAFDILEGGEFTRIQYIQQVRYSDLIKAFEDEESDISYAYDDTLKITGIVTSPTGLNYAGTLGSKFLLEQEGGGPWSGILSYTDNASTFPDLFEGDVVEMTGFIKEYPSGPANMTELFITEAIDIVDYGVEIHLPSEVNTGDMRLPVDAEQWGNVMVYVKDAVVTQNGGLVYNEMYKIDDGSGEVILDADSDSLQSYDDANPRKPIGTIADSIRGWVYHHFGSYADCTAYKLEPPYGWDITWGAGPPQISSVARDIDAPTATDPVNVTADFATNLTIAHANLYYEMVTGGVSSGYTLVAMTNTTGETYTGQIPATAAGSFINYYLSGEDSEGQTTVNPSDTSVQNYCYPVLDGVMTIANVQYTPWYIADSPMEGAEVTLSGVITADTVANNAFEAYAMQDAADAWNGILLFGISQNLYIGDQVTVTGTITDYNSDWAFKWNYNTCMLVDNVTVDGAGDPINSALVTTAELNGDTTSAESYEGVLVRLENATLVSINSYDATFDDGSGGCLVDDDWVPSSDFYINRNDGYVYAFGDTVREGEVVSNIQGVFNFSFNSFKLQVRGPQDWGIAVGIDPHFETIPLSYQLKQNYPNPFNPTTSIAFEIPQTHQVKILVYNVLGQKIRVLANDNFKAGRHTIHWDGHSDNGFLVPSGVYIYRIIAGDFVQSKKMVMLK